MPLIKLQSSDLELFPVDAKIARQSVTIRTMLDDLGEFFVTSRVTRRDQRMLRLRVPVILRSYFHSL